MSRNMPPLHTLTGMPYRVIVVSDDRSRSTYVIQLGSAPYPGDELELPHGEVVSVVHVTSGSRDGFAGVIIAGPHL